jgi:hypothetical protein
LLCPSYTIVTLKNKQVKKYHVLKSRMVTSGGLKASSPGDYKSFKEFKEEKQSCGSGMFIPDPNFSTPDPGSRVEKIRIPVLDPHQRI